jgi:hypothetical protein
MRVAVLIGLSALVAMYHPVLRFIGAPRRQFNPQRDIAPTALL